MSIFSHCRHCAWNHPAHVEVHATSCGSWCSESVPISDEPTDLLELLDVMA